MSPHSTHVKTSLLFRLAISNLTQCELLGDLEGHKKGQKKERTMPVFTQMIVNATIMSFAPRHNSEFPNHVQTITQSI